jgi:ABC-type uncharacterized transport system ATPase subunit
MSDAAVTMRGIVKRFGGVPALDCVDFELRAGEIHALLGENGAGKTTLMSVLAGLYLPDAGTVLLNGQRVRFRSAGDAARAGIGMVHQHFKLVANLTVAENLALALPETTPAILPRRGLGARALVVAERLGWRLDPGVHVWHLPVGVQQRLEIVKVLAREPRVVVLDEPTAVLAPVELDELFAVLRRLREEGRAIVFISHKLNEVLQLCDRVTVLRHGRNAGTVDAAETSASELARRMLGAETQREETLRAAPAPSSGAGQGRIPVLRVDNLHVPGARGVEAVQGLSLEVRAGEIYGVAGVDGNGQEELAEAIVGLRKASAGTIELEGRPAPPRTAADGPGYIPSDRRRSGLVAGLSVRDNLVLELTGRPEASWGPWLRWHMLNREAEEMARAADVRAASLAQPVETLSGGNQQKIVIARALRRAPRLLVAVNPTRGLDVGAAAYVHERLHHERARGAAVLLISTELEEVLQLADRIGVLYEGRLAGEVLPSASRETLGLLMGGRSPGPELAR